MEYANIWTREWQWRRSHFETCSRGVYFNKILSDEMRIFSLDYKGLSMAFKKLKKPFENFIFDGYCLYYNCYCLQNYITIFMSNLLFLNAAEAENVRFQLEEH